MFDSSKINGPHKNQPVLIAGKELENSDSAMILIHGRGATAASILNFAEEFKADNILYIAPQAENATWYPHRFLEPIEKNEPWLSSGLEIIDMIERDLISSGISENKIYLLGFSQGACLALEYAARNPGDYGGIFCLSGALIGMPDNSFNYQGTFPDTPVFMGCSDDDFHIPIERFNKSAEILERMGAKVEKRIYENMGHTVNKDEVDYISNLIVSR